MENLAGTVSLAPSAANLNLANIITLFQGQIPNSVVFVSDLVVTANVSSVNKTALSLLGAKVTVTPAGLVTVTNVGNNTANLQKVLKILNSTTSLVSPTLTFSVTATNTTDAQRTLGANISAAFANATYTISAFALSPPPGTVPQPVGPPSSPGAATSSSNLALGLGLGLGLGLPAAAGGAFLAQRVVRKRRAANAAKAARAAAAVTKVSVRVFKL